MNLNQQIEQKLLQLAKRASLNEEIPVSAVITYQNKILSYAYNKRESLHDITAHAEILAIKKAAKKLKRWNLNDCDLYVSLKPCNMCLEVIKQSRIKNVYYYLDKPEYKHDFNKSNFIQLSSETAMNDYPQLLSNFFKNKR